MHRSEAHRLGGVQPPAQDRRRSRSTPLIITSAEATEKDFEDHKKLKTRAEDYLHKPFGVEALVEKIGGLIGMPEPPIEASTARRCEMPMEAEEVAIEDDGAIIEEDAADDRRRALGRRRRRRADGFELTRTTRIARASAS